MLLATGDNDIDMYSESGEDTADDKRLDVGTVEEQVDTEGDRKAKRRKTIGDPVDIKDISVSVEDEPMSDDESENEDQGYEGTDADDSALIKEEKPVSQTAKEKVKHSSPSGQPKMSKVAESSKKNLSVTFSFEIC